MGPHSSCESNQEQKSLYDKIERGINQREKGSVQRASFLDTVNTVALFIYFILFLFITLLKPYHGTVQTRPVPIALEKSSKSAQNMGKRCSNSAQFS